MNTYNYLCFFTLLKKEILRFLKVAIQTVIGPAISSLLFLAFQIFCSNSDELSDLTQLQNWGFEVPITLRTDDPMQVKKWHSQWIKKELFSNLPTNPFAYGDT